MFASPRFLPSPRSILSTPRSLLSTPRSLLSDQRERWAAAKAAKNELYDEVAASLERDALRQLSRGQLRYRLRALGAAKSEGDGLTHGRLVDTVLLWNALAELRDSDTDGHALALQCLTDGGLSVDLLMKALLVTGVPMSDLRGISQKTAQSLLRGRLLRFTARQEAFSRIARLEREGLERCFQGWQRLAAERSGASRGGTAEAFGLDYEPAGAAFEHREELCESPLRPPQAARQAGDLEAVSPKQGLLMPTDAGQALAVPALLGRDAGLTVEKSRDRKFEALDTGLSECIRAESDLPEGFPHSCSGIEHIATSATAAEQTLARTATAASALSVARDAKFSALDADLSSMCLEDQPPLPPTTPGAKSTAGTDEVVVYLSGGSLGSAIDAFVGAKRHGRSLM